MPGLTLLSFGGGQDSTALLYKSVYDAAFRDRYIQGRLLVIMADTKDEHPPTRAHVESVQKFCAEHGVEFVHLKPEMGFHRGKWQGYREFLRATNTCGSKAFKKTCTDNLKVQPIYRYLEFWLSQNYGVVNNRKQGLKQFVDKYGKIRVIIGIAAGEESRVGDDSGLAVWQRYCLERVYPLIDLAMDRQACQDYIASCSKPVPPPSNCMLCPFMSEIELLWLHRTYPDDYAEWVRLEQAKVDRFRAEGLPDEKNLGVWGRKLLPQKLAEASARFGHMTQAALNDYKQSHGHCVRSKY